MSSFLVAFVCLILGYFFYGKLVEHIFKPNLKNQAPCYKLQDGVDYIPMPTWKVYMIQFLNIAGTGPVFGAIQGILFGPAAYFWIVLGCIFGGAVHDYMSGMISVRKNGASLPEIVGDELGNTTRVVMRMLTLPLLILVGAVFTTTPASLMANLVGGTSFLANPISWIVIIILYYFMATMLPIDKLIGKVYPLFGGVLLLMAAGMLGGILFADGNLPEITESFTNHHPNTTLPIFPGLFITIACGAVSGFHATQSPLMARCMKNEKLGRRIFYGAMITEGMVALIWCAATIKFADAITDYEGTPYEKLWMLMTDGGTSNPNPANIVNIICNNWLGTIGAIIAILGVVAAPISTGDTAFRSARLIAADFFHIKQDSIIKRIAIALPLFALVVLLFFVDFSILWRYFAWINQTLSIFTFWAITIYLYRNGKNYWISLIPCLFMTAVCSSYILIAPEGFNLERGLSYSIMAICLLISLVWFFIYAMRYNKKTLN